MCVCVCVHVLELMTDSRLLLFYRWIQNLGNPIYTQGFPISVFALPDGITLLGPTNIVLNASMREDFQGSVFRCRVRIPDFEPATANTNITGEYNVIVKIGIFSSLINFRRYPTTAKIKN